MNPRSLLAYIGEGQWRVFWLVFRDIEKAMARGSAAVTVRLSKSRFIAGCQCLKRLYFQVHQPELAAEPDAAADAIIEQGREVGLLARQMFPGGVEVRSDGGLGSGDPRHARANRKPRRPGDL